MQHPDRDLVADSEHGGHLWVVAQQDPCLLVAEIEMGKVEADDETGIERYRMLGHGLADALKTLGPGAESRYPLDIVLQVRSDQSDAAVTEVHQVLGGVSTATVIGG